MINIYCENCPWSDMDDEPGEPCRGMYEFGRCPYTFRTCGSNENMNEMEVNNNGEVLFA